MGVTWLTLADSALLRLTPPYSALLLAKIWTIAEQGSGQRCCSQDEKGNGRDVEPAAKHEIGDTDGDEVGKNCRGATPRSATRIRDGTEEEANGAKECKGDLATKGARMCDRLEGGCTRKIESECYQNRCFNSQQWSSYSPCKTIGAIHAAMLSPGATPLALDHAKALACLDGDYRAGGI